MEVKSFNLAKNTGTYADALAIVGLERLLNNLGARPGRIEDQGGFYELRLKSPVDLEDLDYKQIHDDPGYRYVKLKPNSPVPPGHLDYPAGREGLLNYRELRKSIGNNPTDEQQSQLKQAEPEPRWYLYQNTNVLKGFDQYNKLHESIRASNSEEFATTLRDKLTALATEQDLNEVKAKFKPGTLTIVQVFTPSMGKGVNEPKTSLLKDPAKAKESENDLKAAVAGNLKTGELIDWFDEYLKYLGLEVAANARAVGKDVKLFVMVPGNLSATALHKLSEEFFELRLPWSSAQIDIQGALGLAEKLAVQLVQGDIDELNKKPNDYIAGLQTAYFKSLGNATALANVGFVGLPGWFPITGENADEWVEILEEHRGVLRVLDEGRDEEAELLFLYRDFLSATDTRNLLEFLASYAPHVVRSLERRRFVRRFTTKNLRRLLMSLDDSFKDIVEDSGFRAVAGAIRRATVTEQYHKSQGNQVFDIEYGLFQEFKRKARFPEQFISALSEFVSRYNYENARREEQLKGKSGRRRPQITTEDLDRVVELMDSKDPASVAMLLIAYGSAREPRAPDEAGEMAPDDSSTESE